MASTRPGWLPAELSSFVGRRQELTDVRALLSKSRLLTLTGPGGVGKTRLALRAAAQLQRAHRDGVWLVDLGAVTEGSAVADAVTSVLRVPEQSAREPERALAEFLAGRELLLVMDNCEHVSAAVGRLLSELLSHAPGLQVLATSQEVLGVPGELTYPVEPLSVPGDADPASASSPAVTLFLERASAVSHGDQIRPDDLAAVVGICRRLDGIPLAIELAAAQVRILAPADLVARIDDDRFQFLDRRSGGRVPRHATLRAAVGWSYDLCEKTERLVWQRLSIFSGEFDMTRAEAVCAGHGLTQADVEDAVLGLVDKSVLMTRREPDRVRLRMLDTLRHYGSSRLAEEARQAGERALTEMELRARHLHVHAELAARFEEGWFGPGQPERLRRMCEDLPDIVAALRFAVDHPEHARTGLRMAGSLLFFWNAVAVREGHTWLRRLLDVDREPSPERARALAAHAWLQWTFGNKAAGLPAARESLELTRRLDPERLPRVLHNVGMPLFALGDPEGVERLEESLALCRERGIGGEELAYATFPLALSSGFRGETERADALFDATIELCRAAGDNWWLGVTEVAAAWVAWSRGDLDRSDTYAIEGLRTCRLVADLTTMAQGLSVLGLARVDSRTTHAATLLGAGDRYWADAGGSVFDQTESAARVQEARDRCRAVLGDAAYEAAYRRGWEQPLEEAVAEALGEDAQQEADAASSKDQFGLTPRELEIAALLTEGLSNRAIAERLVLSTRTIETHVQNILVKTGFGNRSMVAVWYAEQNQRQDPT